MVGGEAKHFAILKSLQRLFWHYRVVPLQNISSSCKVNGVIISTFSHLHYFYLQKSYYKGLMHELISWFPLKFPYFIFCYEIT